MSTLAPRNEARLDLAETFGPAPRPYINPEPEVSADLRDLEIYLRAVRTGEAGQGGPARRRLAERGIVVDFRPARPGR